MESKQVMVSRQGDKDATCAFDTLFAINIPHIFEKIFFSLDYKSYKKCFEVSN